MKAVAEMRAVRADIQGASILASCAASGMLGVGVALRMATGSMVVLGPAGYVIGGACVLNATAILALLLRSRHEPSGKDSRALTGQYVLTGLLLAALLAWGMAGAIGSIRIL